MSETSLDRRSVETLHGVGPQLAIKLQKLGLYSIQDLLFHLPLRYIDRTQITPIGGIQPMTEVVIEGEVRVIRVLQPSCRMACGGGPIPKPPTGSIQRQRWK